MAANERAEPIASSSGLLQPPAFKAAGLDELVAASSLLAGLGLNAAQRDVLLGHFAELDKRWSKCALSADERQAAFEVYLELLKDIKGGGTPERLLSRLRELTTGMYTEGRLTLLHCEDVAEEVMGGLFQHIHLFGFLLQDEQAQEKEQVTMCVHQPKPAEALSEGVTEDVWRKRQELHNMKRQHKEELAHLRERHEQELEACRQKAEQLLSELPPAVGRKELRAVVADVLSAHFTVTKTSLSQEIEGFARRVVATTEEVSLSKRL